MALLDAKSFWLDEAESVMLAAPSRGLRSVAFSDGGNFALYYLLLHFWLRFGSSDTFVRMLSVISAVLCIPAIFALGRRLFDDRVGAISAFALAISPFFIAYAQEARGYSLLVLLSILSMLFFLRCLDRRRPGDAATYLAVSTLMIYAHLFGSLVVAAQVVVLLAVARAQTARLFATVYGAMLFLLLPLGYAAYRTGDQRLNWIPPLSAHVALGELAQVSGGAGLLAVYLVLIVVAAFGVVRERRDGRERVGLAPLVVASWIVIPLALTVTLSLVVTPLFVARYLIVALPALVLAGSYGVRRLPRPLAAACAAALFVGLSATGLWHYYFHQPKEDWRGAAALILARAQPGDGVVTSPSWLVAPLQHALDRMPQRGVVPVVIDAQRLDAAGADRSMLVRTFAGDFGEHPRVWVVEGAQSGQARHFHDIVDAQRSIIAAALSREQVPVSRYSFVGIDVALYAREGPTPAQRTPRR